MDKNKTEEKKRKKNIVAKSGRGEKAHDTVYFFLFV